MTYYSYDEHQRLQKQYNLKPDGEMYNVEEFVYYVDSDNNIIRFSLRKNLAVSAHRERKTANGYYCEYYIGDYKNDLRMFTPARMMLNNTIEVFLKEDLIVKVVDTTATNDSHTTTNIDYKKGKPEHIKIVQYYGEKIFMEDETWYTLKKGIRVSSNNILNYYNPDEQYINKIIYNEFDKHENWIKAVSVEPKKEETKREIIYYE